MQTVASKIREPDLRTRLLNHASASYSALAQNQAHQFAARHTLVHYPSGAVCTFIPKNACSSLRLSLAVANGFIAGPEDHNWIHNNNQTFTASLRDTQQAPYTFVILRCPYARLVSVYLDKIVGHTVEAWQLVELLERDRELNDITFEVFVNLMLRPPIRNGNNHWRPQSDFLVYADYDDWFNMADMSTAIATLRERCGIEWVDARPLTRHGLDQIGAVLEDENPQRLTPVELLHARAHGKAPAVRSMYTPELQQIVAKAFAKDIGLFAGRFGADRLMFPPA
jgi:Sulfotransferase family